MATAITRAIGLSLDRQQLGLTLTMDRAIHHFNELFAQLGLANDDSDIALFIAQHNSLSADSRVQDADFWTEAQAQFLRESLLQDADWCGLVDQLGAALERPVPPRQLA